MARGRRPGSGGIDVEVAFRLGGNTTFTKMLAPLDGAQGTLFVGIPAHLRVRSNDGGTIALWKVAWILEYGNPNNTLFGNRAPIPPRPAIRTLWAQKGDSYMRGVQRHLLDAARRGKPLSVGMSRLGERITRDIRRQYRNWTSPALAQYTVRMKGHDDLFVDTNTLISSWTSAWVPGPNPGVGLTARKLDSMLRRMASRRL